MIAESLALLFGAWTLAQDAAREHVEAVPASRHQYRVTMGGVLDAANTSGPAGYTPFAQGFEPMRSVRLENAGDVDLVNPWIVVNGKRRWRTARDIVREALETYGDPENMSDRDKARAVWEYQRRQRFHASTGDQENFDLVKAYNVYGYTLCGDEAPILADLWRLAGLKTRAGHPAGHVLAEVWYDGAWHLLDSDEHVINLLRDNATIAGEEDIVRDHDLVKRTHTYGILSQDERRKDEFSASLFGHDGPRGVDHNPRLGHSMDFTLRPGEALEWRWSHVGKHHYQGTSLRDGWYDASWARLRNGAWTYAPPLRRPSARRGVHSSQNVRWSEEATGRALAPEKPGEPAWAVWEIRSPYVIVGGKLAATGGASFSISADGRQWTAVGPLPPGQADFSLDPYFPNNGPACYRYFLKAEFNGERPGLDAIAIANDVQMSALALPALEIGDNSVAYTDETKEPHSARIVMRWVERSGPPLPAAPAAPVSPPDGGDVEGTGVRFQWSAVTAGAGTRIADYHFQLSDRADLKWVLSSNFEKLISLSAGADVKGASYLLPEAGLLNPGQKYYWRVRAKDDREAWGPWSKIWSFTPQAAGVPTHLRWGERQGRDLTLLWDPSPAGRKPARFIVYASNEKGFSASDKEYQVLAGNQKTWGLFPGQEMVTFPANRLAETSEPRFRVRPSHAYYRVVAVDEKGQRSGVSDYLAAPRPFIYSDPPTQAGPAIPYRYAAKSIASIGDLRCHTVGDSLYGAAFWDAEQPRWTLVAGPAWLKVDPKTGVLSGTPPADFSGSAEVTLAAEIRGVGVDKQTFSLKP